MSQKPIQLTQSMLYCPQTVHLLPWPEWFLQVVHDDLNPFDIIS